MSISNKIKTGLYIAGAGLLWTICEPTYEVHVNHQEDFLKLNSYTSKQRINAMNDLMSDSFKHGILPGIGMLVFGLGLTVYQARKEDKEKEQITYTLK